VKALELKVRSGQPIDALEIEKIFSQFEAITGAQVASTPIQRPKMTGEDLLSALKGLARFFKNNQKVVCTCEVKGKIPMLPEDYVVHLYRIALEAMANAVKHGRAKRIKLTVTAAKAELVLTIASNGKPFPDVEAEKSGMGLRLMHYRASLIKAAMDVRAGERGGTVVSCAVPLPSGGPA
jgi:signal transduction histidine kinase